MISVDDIRDWQGESVVDSEGAKIGPLEAVYFDTRTDEAAFGTVKVGFPGSSRLVFVPLQGAGVSPKHVRVQTTKKLAKDAPSIDVTGELAADVEAQIYGYYGLPYERGASGERRLGRR